MSAFIAACLWILAAAIISAFPSQKGHWPAAYGLIALGVPILVWLWLTNPLWLALVLTLAMASVLRWPLIYLWRWLKTRRV